MVVALPLAVHFKRMKAVVGLVNEDCFGRTIESARFSISSKLAFAASCSGKGSGLECLPQNAPHNRRICAIFATNFSANRSSFDLKLKA